MPFGPGANMMKEFQRNRNQQQDRKSLKDKMDGTSGQRENNLKREELSEERRAEVREEMRRKGRADLIKGIVLLIIIGGALTAGTLLLLS